MSQDKLSNEIPEEVQVIRDRPSPRRMTLSSIYDEVDDLMDVFPYAGDDLRDAVQERFQSIRFVLERRLDIDYPECPNCEQTTVGRMHDGGVTCMGCPAILDADVKMEWKRQDRRLWGKRGHGGNGR